MDIGTASPFCDFLVEKNFAGSNDAVAELHRLQFSQSAYSAALALFNVAFH